MVTAQANLDGKEHTCTFCREDRGSHCFFPIGLDKYNRPVVYACQPRARMNGLGDAIPHMAYALENCFKLPGAAGQWVWIVDFNGFGMRHASHVKVAATTIVTFANNYPERMGCIILLDPPRAFKYMFNAVYPFIDVKTRSKVRADLVGSRPCIVPRRAQLTLCSHRLELHTYVLAGTRPALCARAPLALAWDMNSWCSCAATRRSPRCPN